jgi:hypothetical protein
MKFTPAPCYEGAFLTIYYQTSVHLGLIKITRAIKQNFLNNISTVFKLYWLQNSRYNQLKINLQAMILPTFQCWTILSSLHENAYLAANGHFINGVNTMLY